MNKRHTAVLSTTLAVLLLLFAGPAMAIEGWVPFNNGAGSAAPLGVSVPVTTLEEVVVDLDIPGMSIANLAGNGVTYQVVRIGGSSYTTEIGKPQLPMVGRFVAIPSGATAAVEVVDSTFGVIEGYNIYPAQEPLPDVKYAPVPPFVVDTELYQRDEFYPRKIVQLEGPSVIRGCSVVILRVFPVQFNPVKQALRVYSNIQVRVSFQGGEGYFIEDRLRSTSFDQMFKKLFLNDPTLADEEDPEAAYNDGNSLLIITHPDFLSAANTLATWKKEKGIYTEVRTTTQTGSTASAIQTYIQNAYDNWVPPVTYVLFIGDAEFIPCHYVTSHPYTSPPYQGHVGTDLYYATVDGTDYFPDINTGRLSVDTLTEATKRVNDIIGYEKTPYTGSSFYENVAICAYFQDNTDPNPPYGFLEDQYADRRFAQTSEDLAIYLSDPGYLGQYSVDRIYYHDASLDPLYWSIASWNFSGPAGNPGGPIPSYLLKPGFPWDGSSSDISAAVNIGRFLVVHRDHGGRSAWGEPYYTTSHVSALTNGNRLPVVWSVNCQTGWFDNETDDASTGTPSTEVNFCETWERNANGGAVGIIGATRISYSGHNDRLYWGWTDAIWPNFVPSYSPSGTPFDSPAYEMGPVLNYGKYYYATTYAESTKRKIQFEMFHWFGDPTTEIWTDVPLTLGVSHASTVPVGATSFDVTVDPYRGPILICISKKGEILGRNSFSGGGTYTINWREPLVSGECILITVTGHNVRPYQGTACTSRLPDLVVLGIKTDPIEPEVGKTVDIDVTVKNIGSANAGGFYISWYADLPSPPSPGQGGDRNEHITGLAAGATYVMSTTYTYSATGIYNMYAQVDTKDEVLESNEVNNIFGPQEIVVVDVCECDLNLDGRCDMQDWLLFGDDWGRTDCPIPSMTKLARNVAPNDNPSGNPDEQPVDGAPVFRVRKVEKATPDGQQPAPATPAVKTGRSVPGGDIGDAREEAGTCAPISERLEKLDMVEKQNAVLQLEVDSDLDATTLDEVKNVDSLWNSGRFVEAIEALQALEADGLAVAAGISWKTPKVVESPEWTTDVRIGTRENVKETHLDFDAQTGNLFAVLRYYDSASTEYRWSVNISTNNGQTWQETYQWWASYEIKDTSAAVVDDYLFIGYVGSSAFDQARIRRAFVSNGQIDSVYGWKMVFDKDVEIKEIALSTNADDWDNRVYYWAILNDFRLISYWDDPGAVSWAEYATGVIDAWKGLDATWNEGYLLGSGYYHHVSYIGYIIGGAELTNPVIVLRHAAGVWEEIHVLSDYTGLLSSTSVTAYDDTVICAYEHEFTNGVGIRYNISYNGGDSWSAGSWAPDPGHGFYNPDVTARGGQGSAIVYDDEAGVFDPVWFRYRDHYSPGPWDAEVAQINDMDGATAWPNRIEWVPPLPGSTYGYGAIYISWDPDAGTAYFDRTGEPDICECDLNHDGRCDMQDWLKFGEDWGRTDCPIP